MSLYVDMGVCVYKVVAYSLKNAGKQADIVSMEALSITVAYHGIQKDIWCKCKHALETG